MAQGPQLPKQEASPTVAIPQQENNLPVVPGATGFAFHTPAGRGGRVIRVTNLNDRGPGSLRNALAQSGPRTIIFDVSGTIVLRSPLEIFSGNLTLAGQTAPSPGILIRGSMWIHGDDMLIQHIDLRPGEDGVYTDCLSIGQDGRPDNIVIDHCTFAWGTDELVEVVDGVGNISFRYCLFAEPLDVDKPSNESYGQLMYGDGKVDVQRSFYAHQGQRTPLSSVSQFIFANNICYDRVQRFVQLANDNINPSENLIVRNIFADGPSLGWAGEQVILIDDDGLNAGSTLYLEDNRWNGQSFSDQRKLLTGPFDPYLIETPEFWFEPWYLLNIDSVESDVLTYAGARPADRLPLPRRMVQDYQDHGGTVASYVSSVSDWPDLTENYRSLTLPEEPQADPDGNGYTALEEWLHKYAQIVETGRATGIDYSLNSAQVSVGPNPFSRELHIYELQSQVEEVFIINPLGQELWRAPFSGGKLDLGFLPQGVYILKMVNPLGTIFYTYIQKTGD